MADQKTFLVTGVSSGFGHAFARRFLAAGHIVVGTVRRPEDAERFEGLAAGTPGRAVSRLLDVTDDDAVFATVADVERAVGPIDVVIANAGYGHEGVFEESPMAEMRRQFDVNVFGAVATLKAALPFMRERRRGHLMAVTSMGGLMTVPGLTYYHGSKYALEGILESLAKEVRGLGIRVTAIAPGSFRTDWAGRSMVRTERSIPDYDEVMNPQREHRHAANGKQLGDPDKAAEAVLSVADSPAPPVHLVLGSDALRLVTNGRMDVDEEIARWADLSRSTDFADGMQLG
ncbi:oxidoreductase [Pseudonocardia sp. DSM 110487]|uniref:oxidoreductase n=1 Tax=Pseudonocardia sp. DSM 110487 TaxID=2865833 RepID=UPI001C69C630|nr:oxidoreductase [Pseudonocardia sp. DSM 110487]QYN33697.1 oxidoreductase [Pseudonocardia sp. DSM 110487]